MAERLLHRRAGRARLDRKAELGVELPGRDVVVSVGPDSGRKPEHDLRPPAFGHDLSQEVELVVAVYDYRRAGRLGGPEVIDALVVAQEMHAVTREPGLEREVQLAGRDYVQAEPFLGDHAQELRRCERLGG